MPGATSGNDVGRFMLVAVRERLEDAGRQPGKVAMRRRHWSVRSRVVLLVLPPTAVFVALWLAGTTVTGTAALDVVNARDARAAVLEPGAVVVTELQLVARVGPYLSTPWRPARHG